MTKVLITLAILASTLSSCGRDHYNTIQGTPGATGPQGPQGDQGLPGSDGQDGQDATPVTIVQLCPLPTTYPSTFTEIAFCVSGKLYGTYSANGGFSVEMVPGTYSSNGINSSCSFTVGPNCTISH